MGLIDQFLSYLTTDIMPLVLKPPQKHVTFPPSGNDHKPGISIDGSLNNTLSWAFFFFF